jgi:hypothetical protein
MGLATGGADESFDGHSDTDEGSIPLIWRRRERKGPATWGNDLSGDSVLECSGREPGLPAQVIKLLISGTGLSRLAL